IDRQSLEERKRLHVIAGDLRVVPVVDEDVAGVDIWAADDRGVERPAAVGYLDRPRRAAWRVAGCEARGEFRAAQFDSVAVVQHAVDLRAGPSGRSAFDRSYICV